MGLFSKIGAVAGGLSGIPGGSLIGGAAGGLLDGGGGVPGAPGNSITGGPRYQYQQYEREKVLPDYLQQPYEDTVGAVMDAGTRPFNPYEFQDRPELFAPDERRAQELYRGIPDKYSPYIQGGLDVVGEAQRMALQGPSSELIQGYMNPFIEQTLDVQKRRSLQDYQMMQSDLDRRAGQVGSFGGSRFGLQSAQLADDFGLRQDQLESQMLMGGYDRALAGLERGLERGMDPRYVGGFQSADLQGIGALQQSGQRQYERDFGEFMREETDPMLKAGFLARNIQPLASTVIGERGSSLGYTDPNAGAIAEGLGFGSAIKGLGGLDGIIDMIGGGGTSFGGLGLDNWLGQGSLSSGALNLGGFGIFNKGGRIGYNTGGAVDPYSAYLAAATAGNFVSPSSFSSMPAFTMGGSSAGVEEGAGGLLGALEALSKEQDEGEDVPGPEAETSQDDLSEALEKKNRGGVLGYQQGGLADLEDEQTLFELLDNLVEDRPESVLNVGLNKAKQGLYGATDSAIGAGLEGLGAVGQGISSALMPIEDARLKVAEDWSKFQDANRKGLMALVDDITQKSKDLYYQKPGIEPGMTRAERMGEIGKSKLKQALGIGLRGGMAPAEVGIGIGKWLGEEPEEGQFLGTKGDKPSDQDKRAKEARDYFDTAQSRYDEEQKQLEAFIAAGTPAAKIGADAALELATAGPQGTLQSTPAMQGRVASQGTKLPTTEDIRQKRLARKGLSDAVDKQAVEEQRRRSALLAFGASIVQGGGLAQSLPRAALAYDNAIKSQESAALKQRMELEKLELDRIASDRQQAEADARIKQYQSNIYWKGYENETARMKAAAEGKGTWTQKDAYSAANKAREAAVAAWQMGQPPVPPVSHFLKEQAKIAIATGNPKLIMLYRNIEALEAATGGDETEIPEATDQAAFNKWRNRNKE
jgi:hypothetical protein